MSNKKVFIYSIPRPTATGISDWTNDTTGKKLQKTKVGRCTDSLMAFYSPKVGGLANYISYTPYINPETGSPFLNEEGQPMMLQEHFEKKYGKPKGFFTNEAPLKGTVDPSLLTYFQRQSWTLSDGATVLDLNNMDDEMGYYVALANFMVANSEREWREHKWPRAQYYIALENESDQLKAKRNEIKSKAYASLHSTDLTDAIKRKVVSLLELASSKASLTTEQVNNLLYDFIDKSGFTSGSSIDKFNEVIKLLDTPHGREQFEARYLLKQAIDTRVIYEKQGTYTWVRPKGSLVIGERFTEAIDFILNPKKQAEIEELELEIKAKLI